MQTKTLVSSGDLLRELGIGRAILDRLLRDYARDLPEPQVVGGSRIWPAESIEVFRIVVERDRERRL